MKVLSVDFDYFVDATLPQRKSLFPNGGIEKSSSLNYFVWVTNYGNVPKKGLASLSTVSVFMDELRTVQNIIAAQHPEAFMLADSHRHAYDFICEYAEEEVEVYNVDFHHDTMEDNAEVHCGNWLSHLIHEGIVTKAYWCSKPDSNRKGSIVEEIPFSKLPRTGYDLIYVCRSSWWTPPHLDKYFIEHLAQPLVDSGHYGKLEKGLLENRYTETFQSDVQQYRETLLRNYPYLREISSSLPQ